jgi:invasion protein IalB
MNAGMTRTALRRLVLTAAFVAPGWAFAASLVETVDDWSAFTDDEGGKKVCYLGSEPKKETGDYKSRDDTFILVTHRPAEKTTDVISITAGYTYRKDSEVTLTVANEAFKLFTDGGLAWAPDQKADHAIVAAMKKGANMTVVGTSSRGTVTTDTYSLKGFSAAYAAANKACGIK